MYQPAFRSSAAALSQAIVAGFPALRKARIPVASMALNAIEQSCLGVALASQEDAELTG
jgi:hypothetical protein